MNLRRWCALGAATVILTGCAGNAGEATGEPTATEAQVAEGSLDANGILDEVVANCDLEDNAESNFTRSVVDPEPSGKATSPTAAMTCAAGILEEAGVALPDFPTTSEVKSGELPSGWADKGAGSAGLIGEVTADVDGEPLHVQVAYIGGNGMDIFGSGISLIID